jgi:chromatin structure-remodeling complex subunit RSC3/30
MLTDVHRDIARRNKEAWESFPEAVRYYPAIWNSSRSREECFFTVLTYLDLIYNDFLLQRTLVRRIRARSDELIRISRLLMTTLLDVIGNRAALRSTSGDIPWLVSTVAERLLGHVQLHGTTLACPSPWNYGGVQAYPRS